MKPTQISTITLFPSIVIHAYHKQDTLSFYFWVLVLISSVMHHFTKFNYPREQRTKTLYHHFDIFCVCVLNFCLFFKAYSYSEYTLYFAVSWSVWISAVLLFILSNYLQILLNDSDETVSEFCHGVWHILPTLAAHMFLFVYKKRIL